MKQNLTSELNFSNHIGGEWQATSSDWSCCFVCRFINFVLFGGKKNFQWLSVDQPAAWNSAAPPHQWEPGWGSSAQKTSCWCPSWSASSRSPQGTAWWGWTLLPHGKSQAINLRNSRSYQVKKKKKNGKKQTNKKRLLIYLWLGRRPWFRTLQLCRSRGKHLAPFQWSPAWWCLSPCAWSWSSPVKNRSCLRSHLSGGIYTNQQRENE